MRRSSRRTLEKLGRRPPRYVVRLESDNCNKGSDRVKTLLTSFAEQFPSRSNKVRFHLNSRHLPTSRDFSARRGARRSRRRSWRDVITVYSGRMHDRLSKGALPCTTHPVALSRLPVGWLQSTKSTDIGLVEQWCITNAQRGRRLIVPSSHSAVHAIRLRMEPESLTHSAKLKGLKGGEAQAR